MLPSRAFEIRPLPGKAQNPASVATVLSPGDDQDEALTIGQAADFVGTTGGFLLNLGGAETGHDG